MRNNDDISLLDTIPESIGISPIVKAAITAIDPKLRIISLQTNEAYIYSNIDKLSSLELDHLAYQYDVDAWRDSWGVAMKRSVLKTAIMDKRKVGTLSAVKQAVSSLGGSVRITEWWQMTPKGTPHTFKIDVSLPSIEGVFDAQLQEDLIHLIDGAKPARSHYNFVLGSSLNGKFSAICFLRTLVIGEARTRRGEYTGTYNAVVSTVAAGRAIVHRHLIGKGA